MGHCFRKRRQSEAKRLNDLPSLLPLSELEEASPMINRIQNIRETKEPTRVLAKAQVAVRAMSPFETFERALPSPFCQKSPIYRKAITGQKYPRVLLKKNVHYREKSPGTDLKERQRLFLKAIELRSHLLKEVIKT